MTTDHITATTAADITKSLLNANIDHPDAWIPIQRSDLDIIAAVIDRALQLEANIANMLTLLNGAAPGIPSTSSAPAYYPLPDDLTEDAPGNPEPQLGNRTQLGPISDQTWLDLSGDDLDTQHARFVQHITDGNITWRKLEDITRRHLIYWIIWRIQYILDNETITTNYYDQMKPSWAPTASSLYKHKTFSDWVVDAMEAHDTESSPFRG